jgi:rhamnose utilization protein RhaD (predicted bifunctional aldolase and dehydrogenase)
MVKNRWDEAEAGKRTTPLAQRVYSSRLLGSDPELVMHGGGNTSVKTAHTNLFGESEDVLLIKGSGWDLATIEAPGFPAVRLQHLLKLRRLEKLSDPQMMNELRTHLIDARSPDPSVEALLHAFLPHRFVDHTHADAILTLTNQPDGENRIQALFGQKVAIVPYVMPGFQLAKRCAEIFEKNPTVEGMVLLRHGIFTFGDTAKQSYDRMIALVNQAEENIESETGELTAALGVRDDEFRAFWMQAIRREYRQRGQPCVLSLNASREALYFVNHPRSAQVSQRGPVTPDHVIRTKRVPLPVPKSLIQEKSPGGLTHHLDRYATEYRAYFD